MDSRWGPAYEFRTNAYFDFGFFGVGFAGVGFATFAFETAFVADAGLTGVVFFVVLHKHCFFPQLWSYALSSFTSMLIFTVCFLGFGTGFCLILFPSSTSS